MLDHLSISVNNYQESRDFYDETLKILGVECLMSFESPESQVAGYGENDKPSFWIGVDSSVCMDEEVGKARGFHVAFSAPSVAAVQDWHKKCLDLGGADNGAPGPRPEYHPGYYGAYIIDPNGWRIEVVFHGYKP